MSNKIETSPTHSLTNKDLIDNYERELESPTVCAHNSSVSDPIHRKTTIPCRSKEMYRDTKAYTLSVSAAFEKINKSINRLVTQKRESICTHIL